MDQKIVYDGALTGTLAEAAEQEPLGVPYSPLTRMWQVNPGAEAFIPDEPVDIQVDEDNTN
ncbi:hypothetical protein MXD63_42955 [Frankia sp. Cpl3]|nr:hypothetical protein [Frankia sp. Cpl3]